MTTPDFACPSLPATSLAPQSRTVGLLLRSPRGPVAGYPYVARDSTADRRWSLIIRRSSGSLGKNEAVVTFPGGRPTAGRTTDIGGHPGRVTFGAVTWAMAASYVTLRGDLPTNELLDIAAHVRIRNGRPMLLMPGAGQPITAGAPYVPRSTNEARYDANRLGVAGRVLGGLVFTGVTRASELDDWVLQTHPPFEGQVRGSPAVITSLFGGNAAVAWELRPGTIAYVGYSGAELSETTTQALLCLAQWSRAVTSIEWHAATSHASSSSP